jgi:predicted AAA+ superfamily ATPase
MSRTARGLLILDLAANNPWWSRPSWQDDDPQLSAARSAPFEWRPGMLADIAPPNVYTLRGPRRAGKSTVAKQIIARLCGEIDPRRIVYAAGESFRSRIDLQNFVQSALSWFPDLGNTPRYFFIDEITAVRDWHVAVKWLRDNTAARNHCFVLTGSSAADVAAGTESLAGRRGPDDGLDRLLLPMPFPEFVRCAGYALPEPPRLSLTDFYTDAGRDACRQALVHLPILVPAYEQYLTTGGFPQAVAGVRTTGTVPAGFIRDMRDVVQSDLRRAGVTRPETCLVLLERLAHAMCAPVSFQTLATDLRVDQRTAQAWTDALANSYLALVLFKEQSGAPDLNSMRKFYLTDPVLTLLPRNAAPAIPGPHITQLAEAAAAMAFFRATEGDAVDRFHRPLQVFYHTTKQNTEIDFRVLPADKVADSKYVDSPDHREARAMVANFGHGLLLTRTALDLDHEHAMILPASVFAWLLRQPA